MKVHLHYSIFHEDWRVVIHTAVSAYYIRFDTKEAAETWIQTNIENMMQYVPEGE